MKSPPIPWNLRACPGLYRDCFAPTQFLPLFTVIPRHIFPLQNIKHVSLIIYLILITLKTLRVSLCSLWFRLFLLPTRWFVMFFFGYLPSIYVFSLDSDTKFHTHKKQTKFLTNIALKNLPEERHIRRKQPFYYNLYTTPKVPTPKRRKSKTKNTHV